MLMVRGEPGAPRGCAWRSGLGKQQLRVCDSPWRCRTGPPEGVVAGWLCHTPGTAGRRRRAAGGGGGRASRPD